MKNSKDMHVHGHRERCAYENNVSSFTRSTSHENDDEICKLFSSSRHTKATKRHINSFLTNFRTYFEGWETICKRWIFLLLPYMYNPPLSIWLENGVARDASCVGVDGVCDRLDFSSSLFKNCCVEFSSQSSFRPWVVRELVGRTLFAPTLLQAFNSLLKLKSLKYRKLSPTQIVGSRVSECIFHRSRKTDKRTLMGVKKQIQESWSNKIFVHASRKAINAHSRVTKKV